MAAVIGSAFVSSTIQVGVQALKALDDSLDNKETAIVWYGQDYKTFYKTHHIHAVLCCRHWNAAKQISAIFLIQREDWPLVLKACLPECHMWYESYSQRGGECCWLLLYRSIIKKLDPSRVLKPAASGFGAIGVVNGLPAARIDSWGLIVLLCANGASINVTCSDEGRYSAVLDGKNMVLSIQEQSITAPFIAHLEPREHPNVHCQEPLSEVEMINLLWNGHTFAVDDIAIGWPLNDKVDSEPPKEFHDGRFSKQLERVVLSFSIVDRLRAKLKDFAEKGKCQLEELQPNRKGIAGIGKHFEDCLLSNWNQDNNINLMDMSKMRENLGLSTANQPNGPTREKEVFRYLSKTRAIQEMLRLSRRIPQQLSTESTGKTVLLAW